MDGMLELSDIEVELNGRELAMAVFATAVDSMIVIDHSGNVRAMNPAAVRTFGYSRDELIGHNITRLMPESYAHGHTDHLRAYQQTRERKVIGFGREVVGLRKDGSCFPMHLSVGEFELGGQTLYVGICHDISQRRKLLDQLTHLAAHDSLTGCLNRNQLHERLQQAVNSCAMSGEGLAVVFVDLDGFKLINDRYDHHVGDCLLTEVAQRIQGVLHMGDLLARVGGDEFVVVAQMADLLAEPRKLGQRILERVSAPLRINGRNLRIGASLGISLYPGDSKSPDQLLNDADLAMYQAKAAGGNCVQVFQRELRHRREEELRTIERLRKALALGKLELHYQLQFELAATYRPIGIEALLRWRDGGNGLIPPDKFIPLAEQYGLMADITAWVLEQACRDNLELIAEGLIDVPVAVNICGSTFLKPDFFDTVQHVLHETGMPSDRLELEITEEVAVSHIDEAVQFISRLQLSGIMVTMDDFGTGYSSPGALKQLPFDRLKIDRSFVSGLPNDRVDRAIVKSMLIVAESFGMQVVAEGIETAEQLAFLQKCGCSHGQGYWFARPVPLAQLKQKFSEKNLQLSP